MHTDSTHFGQDQSTVAWIKGVWVFRCNLHFWQNDLGLLGATVGTLGWNGHQIRVSKQC